MSDWIDLTKFTIDPTILRLVPGEIAKKFLVLPIRLEGDALVLAAIKPPDPEEEDYLRFVFNRDLQYVTVPITSLKFAIWRYYGAEPESLGEIH